MGNCECILNDRKDNTYGKGVYLDQDFEKVLNELNNHEH